MKEISRKMAYSKSAANGLGLNKQDNTNYTSSADMEKLISG